MRLAILADVHANLPALEAVLRDVDSLSPAGLWVAGDLVRYNPWPNEVLQVLRDRHAKAIRGNHDRGVLGGGCDPADGPPDRTRGPPVRGRVMSADFRSIPHPESDRHGDLRCPGSMNPIDLRKQIHRPT